MDTYAWGCKVYIVKSGENDLTLWFCALQISQPLFGVWARSHFPVNFAKREEY